MGQIVLGVAGSIVGNMILPGFGGSIGGLIGSAIGGALFADSGGGGHASSPAPSLMDLKITGTDYGQCIPYVRGAARIAGQIWWNSDRRPTTTTSSGGAAQSASDGGKGGGGGGGGSSTGPVTVTTTTYDMDMLVGLTNNVIIGVRRIWNNGALVYTASTDATPESVAASAVAAGWARMTVYTGAADQLPDPTYEAAVTTTLACAYRGRGSVFIQGLQLGQGGQVPNLTFEVVVDGSVMDEGLSTVVAYPSTVAADGVSGTIIEVTLLDSNSNPLPGRTVSVASSSSCVIDPASNVTDEYGKAYFYATNAVAETSVFIVTDQASSVELTQQPSTVFAELFSESFTVTSAELNALAYGFSDQNPPGIGGFVSGSYRGVPIKAAFVHYANGSPFTPSGGFSLVLAGDQSGINFIYSVELSGQSVEFAGGGWFSGGQTSWTFLLQNWPIDTGNFNLTIRYL